MTWNVRPCRDIAVTSVDGDVLILNAATDRVTALSEPSAKLWWALLAGSPTPLPPDETAEIVDQLLSLGLVEPVGDTDPLRSAGLSRRMLLAAGSLTVLGINTLVLPAALAASSTTQVFTTPGTYTLSIPTGMTSYVLVGGGGASCPGIYPGVTDGGNGAIIGGTITNSTGGPLGLTVTIATGGPAPDDDSGTPVPGYHDGASDLNYNSGAGGGSSAIALTSGGALLLEAGGGGGGGLASGGGGGPAGGAGGDSGIAANALAAQPGENGSGSGAGAGGAAAAGQPAGSGAYSVYASGGSGGGGAASGAGGGAGGASGGGGGGGSGSSSVVNNPASGVTVSAMTTQPAVPTALTGSGAGGAGSSFLGASGGNGAAYFVPGG
jgi:hypothetical protein